MIQNIWAVGRNYAEHAKELGNATPTEPLIFLKAGSTAVFNKNSFELPTWTTDVHHELELALQFDENLKLTKGAIALDLTERTIQSKLKSQGHPWTLAKSFKESTPLSDWFPIDPSEFQNLHLSLYVNEQLRQEGFTGDMIFDIQTLRSYILERFPVVPQDIILTGTPAGVGRLQPGDRLVAEIRGKIKHSWVVRP